MKEIKASELILNDDGSIYHLHLHPEDIADTIILVGDQGRVPMVSQFFDTIDFKTQNREFITHTGTYKNKRISVLSTGIGTDNIDIVVNELDALVNIDLKTRKLKDKLKKLNFVRIGTTGALQENLDVDSFLLTKMAIGFDGLLNFYADRNQISNLEFETAFIQHTGWNKLLAAPYFVEASEELLGMFEDSFPRGMTISAPGFYGPQGRKLRLDLSDPDLNDKITRFEYENVKITNYEMESSAIYGLSKLLGHNAITVCLVLANRITKNVTEHYQESMNRLIKLVLDNMSETEN